MDSYYREQVSGLDRATIYMRYHLAVPGKLTLRGRENLGIKQDGGLLLLENGAWNIALRGARPLGSGQVGHLKGGSEANGRNIRPAPQP